MDLVYIHEVLYVSTTYTVCRVCLGVFMSFLEDDIHCNVCQKDDIHETKTYYMCIFFGADIQILPRHTSTYKRPRRTYNIREIQKNRLHVKVHVHYFLSSPLYLWPT